MGNNTQQSQASGQTGPATNNKAAEAAAMVTAAAPPPSPLLAIAMADPGALDNVQRRVAETKAKRGRSSLRIPLSSTSAKQSGGIAIPL